MMIDGRLKYLSKDKEQRIQQLNLLIHNCDVYNAHKERFDNMNCFKKYKSYTNTNCMPAFCRDMKIQQYLAQIIV